MRAALETLARRWWAGELHATGRVLSALAWPLSWAWSGASAIAGLRRAAAGSTRVDGLTVISVGNLAVGGTGKTPVVAWIAATLREEGTATAVLVGGSARDEALLHSSRTPGVPVIVRRDRVEGARQAAMEGADIALLDDGFQHRRLQRDLDIVLLAVEDSFPGHLLPRGPYREPPSALTRADVVLVTRRAGDEEASRRLAALAEASRPGPVTGGVHLSAATWTDLAGRPAVAPHRDVIAACGIARPDVFRSAVAGLVTGEVELVAFADHHEYTPADIVRLNKRSSGRPIVITEKDAVKLRAYEGTLGEVYVLAEEVRWDWGQEAFLARLREVVAGGPRP